METLLYTIEEAAEQLRLGRTSVYRLVASGELGSISIGRARRIPHAVLVAYVNGRVQS